MQGRRAVKEEHLNFVFYSAHASADATKKSLFNNKKRRIEGRIIL
jgi:hypothetical protein